MKLWKEKLRILRGNTPSNKTQSLTERMNMANWVIAGMILSFLSSYPFYMED